MTPNRHGSSVNEYPNELEIVTTREFDAPLELVFDVLTKPEHVRNWFAPFTCQVTECAIEYDIGESGGAVASGRGPTPTLEQREKTDVAFALAAYGTSKLSELRRISTEDIIRPVLHNTPLLHTSARPSDGCVSSQIRRRDLRRRRTGPRPASGRMERRRSPWPGRQHPQQDER